MVDVVPLCCDNPCVFPQLAWPVKWLVNLQCIWHSGEVPTVALLVLNERPELNQGHVRQMGPLPLQH